MLRDTADVATRNQIMKLLSDLAADPANGIERIVPATELHDLGGFPQAIGLVVLRPPFQLGYAFSGPLVTPAPATGMHGYLPSNPDMLSTFMLAGRGIAQGRSLETIDMVQIAPTLASVLGIPFQGSTSLQVR